MSRTIRNPLPARRGQWDPEFRARLERGLVDLEKRDHTDMLGDIIWGPTAKARAKSLRNRRLRRVSRMRVRSTGSSL